MSVLRVVRAMWTVKLLPTVFVIMLVVSCCTAACSFGCPPGQYEASPCGTNGDRVCVGEYSIHFLLSLSFLLSISLSMSVIEDTEIYPVHES